MGCLAVLYVIILFVDLLVGTALIVWKCTYSDDMLECKLATGGTLGSLAIWLLLLLVCPFCVIKCDLHDTWGRLGDGVKNVLKKIKSRRPRQIYIQSEIYLPTTLSMRSPRDKVAFDVNIMTSHLVADDKSGLPLMIPKSEDVLIDPAVVYTFNEANGSTGSVAMTKYLEADDH